MLQWLRQWGKSEIEKSQKIGLLANFLTLDTILAEFTKIIKENLCGFVGDTNLQAAANYILTKLELYIIFLFEDYVQTFKKYYYLIDPPANQPSLDQFFHKLHNPWDELCIKTYPHFIKKMGKEEYDNLGFSVNYVLRLIADRCLEAKAKK